MGIFGLGAKAQSTVKAEDKKTAEQKKPAADTASDEAKAMLAKMQAKKEAGDCPFC